MGRRTKSVLLPLGRYEEIARQIKGCIEVGALGGAYIFALDHSIHLGIPGDRARLLFQRAERI